MRWLLVLLLIVALSPVGRAAGEAMEQAVNPIAPGVEQRVQALNPGVEQRVEMVDAQGLQQVTGDATQSAGQQNTRTVGKVIVGVLAAVVSCGVMVASMLLI